MKTAVKTAPGAGKSARKADVPVALKPRTGTPGALNKRLDQWRDWYNPLRGQTIADAISLFDLAQAGVTAELQWVYQLMERRYDMLMCCVESTNAALLELNWYVRTAEGDKRKGKLFDKALADDQAAALLERYNAITNIYGALEHLAMAKYRGYAHVQIAAKGEWLNELEVLNQWNVAREGYIGDWFWNPRAVQAKAGVVDTSKMLDEDCYLIIEARRCVNEIALINYLRASMVDKDWDAHIEIYGIPSWIVTLPSSIPAGKEDEYRDAAAQVAAGGSGALPHGSEAHAATSPAGTSPFEQRREYLNKQICLVSTGGLLTSLSMPQGLGNGASDAHGETFKRIARARARVISEEFQKKIDFRILNALFPGKPHLAFFEWDSKESTDVGEIFQHAKTAREAGFAMDVDQLQDRSGYKLVAAPMPATVREQVVDDTTKLPDPEPGTSDKASPPEKNTEDRRQKTENRKSLIEVSRRSPVHFVHTVHLSPCPRHGQGLPPRAGRRLPPAGRSSLAAARPRRPSPGNRLARPRQKVSRAVESHP
jgi:hypothetical protein